MASERLLSRMTDRASRNDRELERPEEEETLLPNGKDSKGKSGLNGKAPPPAKAGMCKLPWFGSWNATLLLWLVGLNVLMFWSLPSRTFGGKLTTVRQLWSVSKIFKEDEEMKGKLKIEQAKNAELQKGVSGLEDWKDKSGVAQTETSRLRTQLNDMQSQLDKQREETRKLRAEALKEKQQKEKAEGELRKLRAEIADSGKAASELTAGKTAAEKANEKEKHRADSLAARLKSLLDAERKIFKEEENAESEDTKKDKKHEKRKDKIADYGDEAPEPEVEEGAEKPKSGRKNKKKHKHRSADEEDSAEVEEELAELEAPKKDKQHKTKSKDRPADEQDAAEADAAGAEDAAQAPDPGKNKKRKKGKHKPANEQDAAEADEAEAEDGAEAWEPAKKKKHKKKRKPGEEE